MKRSFDEYFQEACEKGWWEFAISDARSRPSRAS